MPETPEWLRVTDEVKPRREYTIHRGQLRETHEVLDKPALARDATPIPAKYTPAALAGAADDSESASTPSRGRKADPERK
jgi:hypothetical protein